MKNTFYLVFVICSIHFSNAQKQANTNNSEKVEINESNAKLNAIKDAETLAKILKLDTKMQEVFTQVLLNRNEDVLKAPTKEEKEKIFNLYTDKLISGLTEEQKITLIKYNKDFHYKLTHM
ncbi:MAG: hypothetical protein RL607_1369 [Bacteroidota bacterium]|jgi:hypothetical protein